MTSQHMHFPGIWPFKLDESAGFGVKPHIGFLYTSGDDDPTDDTLGGYTGVENAQRFSQYLVVRTPLSATPTWCWAACFTDTCQNSMVTARRWPRADFRTVLVNSGMDGDNLGLP
ncbi:MAG: hypothetical protein R2875_17475 [Desulfobacterales bacterium]